MCMVGLLGEARSLRAAIVSTLGALATALALMITAGWIVLRGVLPAMSQERTMLDAARVLDPLREHPRDAPTALRQRPLAAEKLVEAYDCWPVSVLPLNAATDQLLRATAATTAPPLGLLIRAQEIIDRAVADHRKPASIVLAMNVHAALAAVTDDAQERQRTIALGRRMTEIDPLGVSSWQRLGEALWVAGQRSEAIDAFRTALANDANFALDELKQLSPAERSRLRARIAETSSTPH
jgi:tetratricopeptide (TPR) repeat protein